MPTLKINWLGACQQCESEGPHNVVTENGTNDQLFDDDIVTCGQCGHTGAIGTVDCTAVCEWDEPQYCCECDNQECGQWFEVAEIGSTCSVCGTGKMVPQDIEPWE